MIYNQADTSAGTTAVDEEGNAMSAGAAKLGALTITRWEAVPPLLDRRDAALAGRARHHPIVSGK